MSRPYQLLFVNGPRAGQSLQLSSKLLCIGRGDSDLGKKGWLLLADKTVSRHHANLHWLPAERSYLLEHISHTNATWVNGKKMLGTMLVGDGAQIQMGGSKMLLKREVISISLGAKVSLRPELNLPPSSPTPPRSQISAPGFLQLLPSGNEEPLNKNQANRIGHGVQVCWNAERKSYQVEVSELSSAVILRNRGEEQEVISVALKPVALQPGDILTVDFCQFRFGQSSAVDEPAKSPSKPNPLAQFEIPGYTIVRPLGQGSSGDVLHMKDASGNSVAVKFLRKSLLFSEEAQKRFRREVQVALTVDHPYLLKVLDAGQTQAGQPYLVSELLEGETLEAQILRKKQFDFEAVLKVASDLGAALSYLHNRELIHRDVKPENIFVQNERSILMDYGIVRGADLTNATATGFAIGTPYYMAPEQFRGFTGPYSDQYALGGVLFQLLAGRRIFEGTDVLSLAYLHVNEEPPLLSEFRKADLPPAVPAILNRMLSKAPEARYPTVNAAVQALQETLVGP